jgi:hypothetical protein
MFSSVNIKGGSQLFPLRLAITLFAREGHETNSQAAPVAQLQAEGASCFLNSSKAPSRSQSSDMVQLGEYIKRGFPAPGLFSGPVIIMVRR